MSVQLPDALERSTGHTSPPTATTRAVYRTGSGPAVIVISELPGITPEVADFARKVAADRPHRRHAPPLRRRRPAAVGRLHRLVVRPGLHLARSSRSWPPGRTSPVIGWLAGPGRRRAPAVRRPGRGGRSGMCFTGGFALGMMVDDVVVAPVLSQPSLPLPVTGRTARDLGLSDRGPAAGRGAGGRGDLRPRAPVHRRPGQPPRAVRPAARAAGRRVHRRRARLVGGQPPRAPEDGPFGAHRGPRRPARYPHPGRARPGARLLHRAAARREPRWPTPGGPGAGSGAWPGTTIFTIDIPARGAERPPAPAGAARLPHLLVRLPPGGRPPGRPTGGSLLFDMLGYGLSAKPDLAYSMDLQADVVVAFVDATGRGTGWVCSPTTWGTRSGGELLARQLEGRWDVEVTDRHAHQRQHLHRAGPPERGPAAAAEPARRAAAPTDALDGATVMAGWRPPSARIARRRPTSWPPSGR